MSRIARGPPHDPLTVRGKERLGPIWVNSSQQKFGDIPRYTNGLSF